MAGLAEEHMHVCARKVMMRRVFMPSEVQNIDNILDFRSSLQERVCSNWSVTIAVPNVCSGGKQPDTSQ